MSTTSKRGALSPVGTAAPTPKLTRSMSWVISLLRWSSGAWRNEMWLESMPPSIAWNQLQSCMRLEAKTWSAGSSVHSRSGSGGGAPCPM